LWSLDQAIDLMRYSGKEAHRCERQAGEDRRDTVRRRYRLFMEKPLAASSRIVPV
jgi:hypothetical protein